MLSTWLLTAAPNYLAHAMNEMKAIDPGLSFRRPIELGVVPFDSQLSEWQMTQALKEYPPIFIRHIHAVHVEIPTAVDHHGDNDGEVKGELDGSGDLLDTLITEAVPLLDGVADDATIGIQIRREEGVNFGFSSADVRDGIQSAIESLQNRIVTKNPDFILSLFLTTRMVLMGVSPAEANLSDWPGGAMRLRMEPHYPSRSRLKLEEAFHVFNLYHLDLVDALDIGASPGGWTSFLLDQGFKVTAVDTGDMDARLLKNSKLRFIKENVHQVKFPVDSFDLLTCDMSWSPYVTCERIVSLAPTLREDGRVLVTIKLLHQKVTKTIKEVLEILQQRYEILGCKQLFHNRDEVTVYLRKN